MLYIFDLDGTIVEKFGTQPLPNVIEHLERLANDGHQLAVATNQAGLAWRVWTQNPKYPDVPSLAQRFEEIAYNVPPLAHVPWFVSLFDNRVCLHAEQYVELSLELNHTCPTLLLHVQADPTWRKPLPGMLLAIGNFYHSAVEETIFVGDYKTDAEAASVAGIQFFWADDFFCQHLV